MFSAAQQRTWTTSHLSAGAWYLDCLSSFTPSFEVELRKSRDSVGESGAEMQDLLGIEDEAERAKALKRRVEEDRRKAQKIKEAEEKALQREEEKQQKAAEKSSKKGKRKVKSPGGDVVKSPISNSGSQAPPNSRGTKRNVDSTYEEALTQVPNINVGEEEGSNNRELIINSSLKDVLAGSSNNFTQAYLDIKSFLLKVLSNVQLISSRIL
jgi:hypothetical protein